MIEKSCNLCSSCVALWVAVWVAVAKYGDLATTFLKRRSQFGNTKMLEKAPKTKKRGDSCESPPGLSDKTWTCGLYHPKVARYQLRHTQIVRLAYLHIIPLWLLFVKSYFKKFLNYFLNLFLFSVGRAVLQKSIIFCQKILHFGVFCDIISPGSVGVALTIFFALERLFQCFVRTLFRLFECVFMGEKMKSIKKFLRFCFLIGVLSLCFSFPVIAEPELNERAMGNIPIDLNTRVEGEFSANQDSVCYSFKVEECGGLKLSFSAENSGSWTFRIYNSENTNFLNTQVTRKAEYASSFYSLPAGTYSVEVCNLDDEIGSVEYTLTMSFEQDELWEQEPNDGMGSAKEMRADTSYKGMILNKNDEDYFSFVYTDQLDRLIFSHAELSGTAKRWKLRFVDENNASVSSATEIALNQAEKTVTLSGLNLTAGKRYYIVVSGASSGSHTAQYTLLLESKQHTCDRIYVSGEEATCKTTGTLEHWHCNGCGKKYDSQNQELETVIIPLKSHTWGAWEETKKPTCSAEGTRSRVCRVCQCTETEDLAKSDHDFAETFTQDRAPTCVADGVKSRHCKNCSAQTDVTVLPKLGHQMGAAVVVTAATCTEDGLQRSACSRCTTYYENSTLEKLGHLYESAWTTDVEATCGRDGEKSHHCSRCSARDQITTIPKASMAHQFGAWEETKKPTCSEEGTKSRVCLVCQCTETEDLAKSDHDFAETFTQDRAPTCVADGVKSRHCKNCSAQTDVTVLQKLGHQMGAAVVVTAATCTEDGLQRTTCSRCTYYENSTLEKLGHRYESEWTTDVEATCTRVGSRSRHCTGCHEKTDVQEIPKSEHQTLVWVSEKTPTCMENGKSKSTCESCGGTFYKTVDALGHSYEAEWKTDLLPTCQAEGSKSRHCKRCSAQTDVQKIDALPHSSIVQKFDKTSHWYECGCGEKLQLQEHDFQIYVQREATCKQTGYAKYDCRDCDNSYEAVLPYQAHRMGEWSEKTSATCDQSGERVRECIWGCGEKEVQSIEKLAHRYSDQWTVDLKATCLHAGSKSHHCQKCDSRTDVTAIPAVGHMLGDWIETVAPTCTEKGKDVRKCSSCDFLEERTGRDALGHALGDWVETVAPTCVEKGKDVRKCSSCNFSEERTGRDALGHAFGDWLETVAPTCTEKGKEAHTCSACNLAEERTGRDALGHAFGDWLETAAPTCTEKGKEAHTCSACTLTEERTGKDALGHAFGTWSEVIAPTCTQKGVEKRICLTCNTEESRLVGAALGHSYDVYFTVDQVPTCEAQGSKSRHCQNCDARIEVTVLEPVAHVLGDWMTVFEPTCTEKGVRARACENCDFEESESFGTVYGHRFEAAFTVDKEATCLTDGSKSRHCMNCDASTEETSVPATGHRFGEFTMISAATCTEMAVGTRICGVCDFEETASFGSPLGHSFDLLFTVDQAPTCEGKGSESRHCRACNARTDERELPPTGHSYGDWQETVMPTCKEAGFEMRECSVCQAVEGRGGREALGHAFESDWTVDEAASCHAEGSQSRYCSRCSEVIDRKPVVKTEHAYDNGVVTVEPTCERTGTKVLTCTVCHNTSVLSLDKLPPVILGEVEREWNPKSETGMTFRSAAPLVDFLEVRVNGEVVPRDCYILREGSTIVEFKPEYLKTLEGGVYTIEIVSTSGIAEASLEVVEKDTRLWLWLVVGIASILAVGVVIWISLLKKRNLRRPAASVGGAKSLKSVKTVKVVCDELVDDAGENSANDLQPEVQVCTDTDEQQ